MSIPVLQRVISGGQTGVDRAALDAAQAAGIPTGGWCPAGRWAEDGPIDGRYPLIEAESPDLAVRTCLNVQDSGATLVLTRGVVEGGTQLTVECARNLGRPVLVVDTLKEPPTTAVSWIRDLGANRLALNVAGPRESEAPGIYEDARAWLAEVLEQVG